MSDEGPHAYWGDEVKEDNKRPVTLSVTLTPDGDFKVESPHMNDQMLMLGLIETAKLAVIQYNAQRAMRKAKSAIVQATHIPPKGLDA